MMLTTTRLGLEYPQTSDNESAYPPVSAQQMGVLDNAVIVTEGTLVARPAVGSVEKDHIYRATDTDEWYITDGTTWQLLAPSPPSAGASNIAASQSTSSTSFTTLGTPDQITGLVVPTNGLVKVRYQALWQCSASAAQAAIFIGSNQLTIQGWDGSTGHQPLTSAGVNLGGLNANMPLFSFFAGLGSGQSGTGYSADVTTGQAVGFFNADGGEIGVQIGAAQTSFYYTSSGVGSASGGAGGPCEIAGLAAGTYTISVQFKTAGSGSVTASNRKLWAEVSSFS